MLIVALVPWYNSSGRSSPHYQQFPNLRAIGFSFDWFQNGIMKTSANGFWLAVGTAILLGTVSVAALANQFPTFRLDPATPLCYCRCAYETGTKHCTKMCELPQFQSRWWALSCHKKNSTENESSSPASNPGSRKTNRAEEARQ